MRVDRAADLEQSARPRRQLVSARAASERDRESVCVCERERERERGEGERESLRHEAHLLHVQRGIAGEYTAIPAV
jgi:hypothetical protein